MTRLLLSVKLARFISLFLLISILFGSIPSPTFAAPAKYELTSLYLYANIETVGVMVGGTNLPLTADLFYRQSGKTDWHRGHTLIRIDNGALVGSLFDLLPATTYEVKVRSGEQELSASTVTQPVELNFSPSRVLHVNSHALHGGDGSAAKPFYRIQDAIDQATPGTQVLVADGIYREELTFPNSGSAGNWIQVQAAGDAAILDGSRTISGDVWSAEGKEDVWSKQANDFFAYLVRDGERFFQYDGLGTLRRDMGGEGWYLDPNTLKLYIRSRTDPATHTWQIPFLNQAFVVDDQDWVWIEGFEMRYYGTGLSARGVFTRNASHIVIRKNKIHNIRYGIFVDWTRGNDGGNDTRVEYNEISDSPVNEWRWANVKGTSMEGTAVVIKGHIGAIVRGNDIHNFFNGIYTGSSADRNNPELAFDIDVYDNYFHQISDDALEPEGACVNHRFRDNIIDDAFVGVSLAPISIGPTWVLHSVFSNYTERGIKWDRRSNGYALIYHNTFWTEEKDLAAMDFISPVKNAIIYNNIFQNTGYSVYEVQVGSTKHNWDHNNWRTPKSPGFIWEAVNYANIEQLCAAKGLACHSHSEDPQLKAPEMGDFSLVETSPNIDRGVSIPGINDYFVGTAPDIGAYEFGLDITPPLVESIQLADPNPTQAETVHFIITFSQAVTGLSLSPPFSDFVLQTSPITSDAAISAILPLSENQYAVQVNTGSEDSYLRLDLVDQNTIFNANGIPLGGKLVEDGSYNTGDFYTVDKTPPSVQSITRTLPNPTAAEFVNFTVQFTEPVTGVDVDDFTLTTTGELSGAQIAAVNGSGDTYTLTTTTGSRNGSLRLDLIDDDSIVDVLDAPLGGLGTVNGSFTSGEVYTVNKTTLETATTTLISNARYDGWVLEEAESSETGGTKDAQSPTLMVGDDANNKQYRSILDFSTRPLPNDITIKSAMLMLKKETVSSADIFTTHGNILIDVQDGAIGKWGPFPYRGLQKNDFESAVCENAGGILQDSSMDDWYWVMLNDAALDCINRKGSTQLRLRFALADDNDLEADYLRFYSGDAENSADRPYLIVEYFEN